MPTDPAHVCLSEKTGSERRAARLVKRRAIRNENQMKTALAGLMLSACAQGVLAAAN
jgi:hypothetical protein